MKEKNNNQATATTKKEEETYTCHILSIVCILFYIFNDKASTIVFWTWLWFKQFKKIEHS